MTQVTLNDFVNRLQKASSIRTLNDALRDYLFSYGITMFAFTYYSYAPSSINKLKYDYASPEFSVWHQHYLDEGYEDIDSTLDVVYQSRLPQPWDLREQLKQARNPRERQMRKHAIEFGAEKGISIPLHGPHDDFAILVIVQMHGQHFLEKNPMLQYELLAVGYLYYDYLQKQLLQSQTVKLLPELSAREIQCLMLVAKNYSTQHIAKILSISERTVNYHIQRLNKKLGTANKYQSVIKALTNRLINL
jgi:LuxR family transcriptional activator of bioluminescence operon